MQRDDLIDLNAFMAVAGEQSLTRAAACLGTSQSALSHTIGRLEQYRLRLLYLKGGFAFLIKDPEHDR